MFRIALLAAAAALTGTAADAAVLVQWTPGQVGPAAGQTLVRDFEGANAMDGIRGTGFGLFTGTTTGVAAMPMGNDSQYLAVFNGGSATIGFAIPTGAFAIDIGSVDAYNRLTINYAGGGSVSFQGAALIAQPPANGDQLGARTNGRARFAATDGRVFESITLTSSGNSFEVDNLATTAVPEPASWAMMIGGFGLIGSAMRRRRTTRTVAFA